MAKGKKVTKPTAADLKAAQDKRRAEEERNLTPEQQRELDAIRAMEEMVAARKLEAKPGRHPKITPDLIKRIGELISGTGCYVETACNYVGISNVVFYGWMKKGHEYRNIAHTLEVEDLSDEDRKDLEHEAAKLRIYHIFLEEIEIATSRATLHDLGIIRRASARSWQAAAWRLERSRPDHWGRRVAHELTGKDGGPVETKVDIEVVENRKLTKEEFLKGVLIEASVDDELGD